MIQKVPGGYVVYPTEGIHVGMAVVVPATLNVVFPKPEPPPEPSPLFKLKKPNGGMSNNGGLQSSKAQAGVGKKYSVQRDAEYKDALCPNCRTYNGDRINPAPIGTFTCKGEGCGATLEVYE